MQNGNLNDVEKELVLEVYAAWRERQTVSADGGDFNPGRDELSEALLPLVEAGLMRIDDEGDLCLTWEGHVAARKLAQDTQPAAEGG